MANLISLPIQWNVTLSSRWAPWAVDPASEANRTFHVVNVQPVVPFRLNDDWLLVSRTIVPVIQRPLAGRADVIGIGDINPTVFLVPRSNSPVQFGLPPGLLECRAAFRLRNLDRIRRTFRTISDIALSNGLDIDGSVNLDDDMGFEGFELLVSCFHVLLVRTDEKVVGGFFRVGCRRRGSEPCIRPQ